MGNYLGSTEQQYQDMLKIIGLTDGMISTKHFPKK